MAATKQWSQSSFQRGESAEDVYWVDAADESAAGYASGVPQQSTSHLRDLRLLAQVPVVRPLVIGALYEVRVRFVRLRTGQEQQEEDPLDQPPIIHWQIGISSEAVDADPDGNPLVNTVGDLFENQTEEFLSLFLDYTRNESTFDIQKALAFSNKTNSDTLTIRGPNGDMRVDPGQGLCRFINAEPYAINAPFVPVKYSFEFREDGFIRRLVDQGLNGIWSDSGTNRIGQFCNAATPAQIITTPVRLDGSGKPLKFGDVEIKVIDKSGNPQAPVAGKAPAGATIEKKTGATFLNWKRKKTIAFAGLGL